MMDFVREVFIKYWKEVIVAMLLTATLPFFRRYVRRLRAKVIAFLTVKKRLEAALAESESKRKEAEEQLAQERTVREEAEQTYLVEAEERRKAQAEVDRLRAELERGRKRPKPEPERKPPEVTKPAPNPLTAKLLELLKACDELPYPRDTNLSNFLISDFPKIGVFLPVNGEVSRIKLMGAINSYIWASGEIPSDGIFHRKCIVFYVLMIIAQGVSDRLITIDDSKKLTWKRADELLDKVNAEYFNEHPEVWKTNDNTTRDAKLIIASAFGNYPPEVILEDKGFIQALLPSTKPATVMLNKSKGFFGRLFG